MTLIKFLIVAALLGLAYHSLPDDLEKEDCIKRGGAPVHIKGVPHCYDVGHKGVNE